MREADDPDKIDATITVRETRPWTFGCLLYTSDAADERSSVDLGGRRIIKKKKYIHDRTLQQPITKTNTMTSNIQ